jgi:hypothetical protein
MTCPVCDGSIFAGPTRRCTGCGCVALAPRPETLAGAIIEQIPSAYVDLLRKRGLRGDKLLNFGRADVALSRDTFDAAISLRQLQAHAAPGELLQATHAALRPRAPLLVTIPRKSNESDRWLFDESTIQLLLLRYGFEQILVSEIAFELWVTAIRCEVSERTKCSIIVAAFNESRTFPVLIDRLLKKEIAGVTKEIVIVESNSTDGTRSLAQRYANHPDVTLVLQDRPLGKGNAVREGFQHATGDVVLIQDADLEYDLDDYEALLAPILLHRALFVLGTRHAGSWKMRQFTQQRLLATGLNLGHAFFTGLINLLFRQHLTDPFTMFKVFRRDALFHLDLECNRFDFDHELVIKLLRKGYRPLEVPVNYRSRSFQEGKKVRMFRDPFTWLWIDLKLWLRR